MEGGLVDLSKYRLDTAIENLEEAIKQVEKAEKVVSEVKVYCEQRWKEEPL